MNIQILSTFFCDTKVNVYKRMGVNWSKVVNQFFLMIMKLSLLNIYNYILFFNINLCEIKILATWVKVAFILFKYTARIQSFRYVF